MAQRDVPARAMLCAALALILPAAARAATPPEIQLELRRFATVARVLMVAAHPDDENTQLIAYLARGRAYRMAYLSVTRGDGGQNVLGPEFGDELGWIRTNELLAARRLDGGEQFFTRARDFGFSKSPAEALRIWDRAAVLGDVVRVIRTFQPDVIVTRFSPTQANTHGHHTASAILALEAFRLAADPTAYPEQLKTLPVWQAKRILQNAGGPVSGGGTIHMAIGGEDPVLGMSYGEIAGRSRAMHKSQGFGNYAGRGGSRPESFALLAGEGATDDIMDGVDTTWARVPGAEPVAGKVADVIARFDPKDPAASVAGLLDVKRALAGVAPGLVGAEKVTLLDQIIQHCLGLTVETTTPTALLTPGAEVRLDHHVNLAASPVPVSMFPTEWQVGGVTNNPSGKGYFLSPGRPQERSQTVTVPADQPVSQPYWLSGPAAPGTYTVASPDLIGRPENPPVISCTYRFLVANQIVTLKGEPRGPDGRRLEVIAPVSLAFPFDVRLFAPGQPRDVRVVATTHAAHLSGDVQLSAPAGWTVAPEKQPFTTAAAGDTATAVFQVTPPAGAASADLHASVTVGGATYHTGWKEIRYAHLPPLLLQPPVALRAVALDLNVTAKHIGYLPGAGDSVAECLTEMGCDVTTLGSDDLDAAKLKRFDAVVVGVRAFNVRTDLGEKAQALFDYAAAGGTVVEQYNRPDGLKGSQLAPYPLRLSASRITDEGATMTFLAPDHPLLNRPNKIAPADFDGWVQERGIYFPTQWDHRWLPILGGSDPGEPMLKGGLLVAPVGQGHVIYTGLVFFRQLPAGVPGAYRLFANLVSLGKN